MKNMKNRQLGGKILSGKSGVSERRRAYRIGVIGDSTALLGFGTRFGGDENGDGFWGRSNDPGHTLGNTGVLTIYSNGTATWKEQDDTTGPVTSVGDGYTWLESGTAGKGMGFCITADNVAASDPGGTTHNILIGGPVSGYAGYTDATAVCAASFLSKFRLNITASQCMGGVRTLQVLNAVSSIFDRDVEGKIIRETPDIIYASTGMNDVLALLDEIPGPTLEEVLDSFTDLANECLSRGKPLIFSTLHHAAVIEPMREMIDDIHTHILSLVSLNPSMIYLADYRDAVDDPESTYGSANSGFMNGPHYEPTGANAQGQVLNTLLDTIVGSRLGRSDYRGIRPNLATNGDFNGTGSIMSGATGDCAWDIEHLYGDATSVCSKEIDPDEKNPWQVITSSGNAAGGIVIISTPLTAIYDRMSVDIELNLTDTSGIPAISPLTGFRLTGMFYDSDTNFIDATIAVALVNRVIYDGENILLRIDDLSPPTGAVTGKLALQYFVDVGGTVSFKARNCGSRQVV